MITGQVNALYEAVIPVHLCDATGTTHQFEAVLDTGFNGTLTLPSEIITTLQLPWRTRGNVLLADGREDTFDIYVATIVWDGKPRHILVEAVDMMPLVGMRLLADHDVWLRVQRGGAVQIAGISEVENSAAS
ncbi:clan AA aspartic protease [Candidatus Sumerlaeota bacterium]|nr:clan AA aspartic protease [Candidatus Sumerlaeota bacterium]